MIHPPQKALILCCADTISAETFAQEARWELLDVANKEGSGSPPVIFPALICIHFKRSGMSGKQSWPDFEEEADEHLRVGLLFFLCVGLASSYITAADQS